MPEEKYKEIKNALLEHIQAMLQEMEEELAFSHQEKYALLEDSLNSATDQDELRVAFEQWYNEHSGDIGWDFESAELWNQAVGDKGVELAEENKDDEEETEVLAGFGEGEEEDDFKADFKNSDEY